MSILIKDMEMPESCYKCTVRCVCDAYFRYKDEHPFAIKSNGRMEDCPLVEIPKHGRLIDADEFYKNLRDQTMTVWNEDSKQYQYLMCVLEMIRKASTIVEREKE